MKRYDYYFEKDQLIAGSWGVGPAKGHLHDFENIVVFTEEGTDNILYVAASSHKGYVGHPQKLEDTHPRVVYHKDKGETHCWRLAKEDENGNVIEKPENPTGDWYRSPLIGYWGWPEDNKAWDAYISDWGGPTPKIQDAHFSEWLKKAKDRAGDVVSAFDPYTDP